ncbi:unnamed protein product [Camellia sinensis]
MLSHRNSVRSFTSNLTLSVVLRKIDSAQVSFTWTLLHFESVFLNLLFFESAHSLTGKTLFVIRSVFLMM